ncbi:hypothetical protein Q7P37_002430 [Cladosporium fusiforme]
MASHTETSPNDGAAFMSATLIESATAPDTAAAAAAVTPHLLPAFRLWGDVFVSRCEQEAGSTIPERRPPLKALTNTRVRFREEDVSNDGDSEGEGPPRKRFAAPPTASRSTSPVRESDTGSIEDVFRRLREVEEAVSALEAMASHNASLPGPTNTADTASVEDETATIEEEAVDSPKGDLPDLTTTADTAVIEDETDTTDDEAAVPKDEAPAAEEHADDEAAASKDEAPSAEDKMLTAEEDADSKDKTPIAEHKTLIAEDEAATIERLAADFFRQTAEKKRIRAEAASAGDTVNRLFYLRISRGVDGRSGSSSCGGGGGGGKRRTRRGRQGSPSSRPSA